MKSWKTNNPPWRAIRKLMSWIRTVRLEIWRQRGIMHSLLSKSQILSTKFQIIFNDLNSKSKINFYYFYTKKFRIWDLEFRIYLEFRICNLEFIHQLCLKNSKSRLYFYSSLLFSAKCFLRLQAPHTPLLITKARYMRPRALNLTAVICINWMKQRIISAKQWSGGRNFLILNGIL